MSLKESNLMPISCDELLLVNDNGSSAHNRGKNSDKTSNDNKNLSLLTHHTSLKILLVQTNPFLPVLEFWMGSQSGSTKCPIFFLAFASDRTLN